MKESSQGAGCSDGVVVGQRENEKRTLVCSDAVQVKVNACLVQLPTLLFLVKYSRDLDVGQGTGASVGHLEHEVRLPLTVCDHSRAREADGECPVLWACDLGHESTWGMGKSKLSVSTGLGLAPCRFQGSKKKTEVGKAMLGNLGWHHTNLLLFKKV